jgi:hypothetical protein
VRQRAHQRGAGTSFSLFTPSRIQGFLRSSEGIVGLLCLLNIVVCVKACFESAKRKTAIGLHNEGLERSGQPLP